MNMHADVGDAFLELSPLFEVPDEGRAPNEIGARHRSTIGAAQAVVDEIDDARCLFLRAAPRDGLATVALEGEYVVSSCAAGGWLLNPRHGQWPCYWLPLLPNVRSVNNTGHILAETAADLVTLELAKTRALAVLRAPWLGHCDLVIWRIPVDVARELDEQRGVERQRWFLWGSHTCYEKPADLFHHLVHGTVYENRFAWPFKRRICSENDAHALYVILSGLRRATGKRLYDLLRRQLVLSVLARQDQDGAFRHGEWTEQMESHFRLHASAMHLMLDALEEWRDARVLDGVRRAAAFLAKQHDIVDDGIWFLHDELERSEQAMKHSPYRWIASRMFGKAASNMLVLNTHLDTTIVLDRYAQGTRDRQFQSLTDAARAVTRKIMSLRPAEALYRVLFRTIRPTFLPKAQQQALPLPLRALKRIGTEHVIPRLNSVKARFPRLVMPGGYIDRAMSLRSWSFHYHTINVMDLLRHRRRFGAETFGPVVEEALAFTRGSGILERWAELRYEKYALGFWAESLYHLCMLDPGEEYRRWLAESVVALEHAALGLPPSLLGSNAEAVRPGAQVACPSPRDARLRTVNLSREGRLEFLVVNPSNEPIRLSWDVAPTRALAWRGRSGLTTGRQGEAEISPGDWLHGTADVLREETASGPAEARRGMVSVVIACYNAEKFIAEALDSVLNQTYGNLELIVVDDASIDRSREILSRYGDRVTVLEQPHQGPYHARNRGVAASRGEFIAFLDADDYWAPTCVEELCSRLIATGAALAYCGWQNVGEESGRGAEPFVPPDFEAGDKLAALLQGGSPWPIHAALLRRSVWDEVGGFDTSLPTTMDYELWLRVAATRPIARVDKVLAYYRFHGGGQISAKRWRQVLNGRLVKQRFVMAHPGLVSHLSPATLAEWIDGTLLRRGYDAFWRRDLESAYRIFRACLAAGAWTARDLRYLLPALLPERAFRALVLRADRRHGPT